WLHSAALAQRVAQAARPDHRLRRDVDHVRRGARHDDWRASRRARQGAGRAAAGAALRRGGRARGADADAGGARLQRIRPGALPQVRLRAPGRAPALLQRQWRGRLHHVVAEHPRAGVCAPLRGTAWPALAAAGAEADRRAALGRGDRAVVNILGIETSCDETSAAVVCEGRLVKSNIIASQTDLHAKYGGVVPELASRQHITAIIPTIQAAMDEAG